MAALPPPTGASSISTCAAIVFHATGKGGVKLEVNNAVLLDLKGIGGVAEAKTQSVRLNKGANPIGLHQPREGRCAVPPVLE